jgi:hypothetical protein
VASLLVGFSGCAVDLGCIIALHWRKPVKNVEILKGIIINSLKG